MVDFTHFNQQPIYNFFLQQNTNNLSAEMVNAIVTQQVPKKVSMHSKPYFQT